MSAGDIVRCTADVWFNAYGEEHRAVTRLDPPRQVTATKRVAGAMFLQFEDSPGNWYWSDGFEPVDRRKLN